MDWENKIKELEKEFDEQVKKDTLDNVAEKFAKFMVKHLEKLEEEGIDEEKAILLSLQTWGLYLMMYQKEGEFPHDL